MPSSAPMTYLQGEAEELLGIPVSDKQNGLLWVSAIEVVFETEQICFSHITEVGANPVNTVSSASKIPT